MRRRRTHSVKMFCEEFEELAILLGKHGDELSHPIDNLAGVVEGGEEGGMSGVRNHWVRK